MVRMVRMVRSLADRTFQLCRGQPDVRSGVAAALTPELGLPRDEDEDRRQEHIRDGREDGAAYGHDDLEPCAGA